MIISHKHKFIYIKLRKTAGTSIEMMLSKICGENDVITPLGKEDLIRSKEKSGEARNYHFPLKKYWKREIAQFLLGQGPACFLEHFTAQEILNRVDEEVWNDYYKFTFDRNPFDKAVSYYFWDGGDKKYGNIKDWINNGGLYSMSSYNLYSIGNRVVVDKVYKYEDMEKGLAHLTKRLNLDTPLQLPEYRAKGTYRKVKDYREVIDPESRALLEVMYARELALLNYQF